MALIWMGTRSAISMPNSASWYTLSGLLVSSRMTLYPQLPQDLRTGVVLPLVPLANPNARLASKVSIPCSCSS